MVAEKDEEGKKAREKGKDEEAEQIGKRRQRMNG